MTEPDRTDTVTLHCLGGRVHGQDQTLPEGTESWLDIAMAETYYVREMTYTERTPALVPTAWWGMKILLHESAMPAADDPPQVQAAKAQAVMAMWTDVMMRNYLREHGYQKPLNEHPDHGRRNGHRNLHLPPDGGNLR